MENQQISPKVGPCNVIFKGKNLGYSHDGMKLDLEMGVRDIFCDQSPNIPLARQIKSINMSVRLNLLGINAGFDLLLDADSRITTGSLGSNLLTSGGELLLIPINAADSYQFRFPNSIIEPVMSYTSDERQPHGLLVKFSANPDENGVYMERINKVKS